MIRTSLGVLLKKGFSAFAVNASKAFPENTR